MTSASLMEPIRVALSFDVEEHYRIEAAAHLPEPKLCGADHADRVESSLGWILDLLASQGARATFFFVGELAQSRPRLVRQVHAAGHEVASHGWNHQRVLCQNPTRFRHDIRRSKETLEQILGESVVGYRAPTFSLVRQTAWAIDILAEEGYRYDSSIFPIRHDRYGVPGSPRGPYFAQGYNRQILEFPPATLRLGKYTAPVGGGGYFRLFPLSVLNAAIRQIQQEVVPSIVTLYFHPWEFDPDHPRLPLPLLSRWRTYVGMRRTRTRLASLLNKPSVGFSTTAELASDLVRQSEILPSYSLLSN